MDGVLIDAREWHFEALNRALSLFGLDISRYDHLVTYDGLPTLKKLELLSLERGLPRGLHRFLNELKQQYTMEIVHARCHPNFTHEYALSQLRQRGYHVAVCSNSSRDTVDVMMRLAGLAGYLDFSLSNQDVSQAKPHPEIYQTAFSRLNLKARECLIVEDNANGLLAARASGAHVMEVSNTADVTLDTISRTIREREAAKC
jgi:HAD superfamily hydrolase (TIGR01509 family)